MACFIFGAGDFSALHSVPKENDLILAADGGWTACRAAGLTPHLLIGDFDSLSCPPDFDRIRRVSVVKDDTDMMLAVKEGLARGERLFHLYGGMGGRRTDHTIANLQTLLYLAHHGARGWLYGRGERYTAICNEEITIQGVPGGVFSVFCFGAQARGVTIAGGRYTQENAVLDADFPLGVSNHFLTGPATVSVKDGTLLIGLCDEQVTDGGETVSVKSGESF